MNYYLFTVKQIGLQYLTELKCWLKRCKFGIDRYNLTFYLGC